jgi:hypothetical protein
MLQIFVLEYFVCDTYGLRIDLYIDMYFLLRSFDNKLFFVFDWWFLMYYHRHQCYMNSVHSRWFANKSSYTFYFLNMYWVL